MSKNRTYFTESKLEFGKHNGKTIREIYTGISEIPEIDLVQIYSVYGETEIISFKDLHIILGMLGKDDLIMPVGQKILLKYLPNPDYLSWCVLNVKGFKIHITVLLELEKLPIKCLTKIQKIDNSFVPIFETVYSKFSTQIINECVPSFEENNSDANDEHSTNDYESEGYCPACQEARPCSCNYSIEAFF